MLRESHRPGIEPATCKSQVQRPTAEPPRRYSIVGCRFDPLFRRLKGCCHGNQFYGKNWQNQTIHLTFRKGLQYRHSTFKKFIFDDLTTLCVNLVNFGPVIPEFTKVKDVHSDVSFFKINLSDKLSQDSPKNEMPFWG